MSGIYIHIPFCRQACHYCNFHFATSFRQKNEMIGALLKEIDLRSDYTGDEPVETIYWGGGTPSMLLVEDCLQLLQKIRAVYSVSPGAEITLETNPDDINEEKLKGWKDAGFNRLSIGIQSFFDDDLQWMNRIHNAQQALDNLQLAKKYFDNISIDLIYGTPLLTNEKWKHNVDTALSFGIPHFSCYALTVEPKTPLHKMIRLQQAEDIDQGRQSEQFHLLMQWLKDAGYEHYEISNFAKPGRRSRHNSSYWSAGAGTPGKKYLGIGPSAHSYDGASRQWNISNNAIYIESIAKGVIPFEKEELTEKQKLNEYIMTSLRTMEGLDLMQVGKEFGDQLRQSGKKYIAAGQMIEINERLVLTNEGKLLADGIAADLFF